MQSSFSRSNYVVNYYHILGLPPPRCGSPNSLSKDELKAAYHKALLLNHPDKVRESNTILPKASDQRPANPQYSIDEIVRAFQTLSKPGLKDEYDKQLYTNNTRITTWEDEASQKSTHLGVETFDLEDLTYNEASVCWSKNCRCGDGKGYTVTEGELERDSDEGEIYVGCRGCSLFIKVVFGLAQEDGTT